MTIIYFARERESATKVTSSYTWNVLADYRINRRRWLAWGVAAGMLVTNPVVGKDLPSSIATASVANLSMPALDALVDTLIPADALTPSASALGVGHMLLTQAESDAGFRPWLVEGMKWLDQGVAGSFSEIDESARLLLLERLANSAIGSQPRTFFELLRARTMTAYYADPRSRVGLAISRPPQPLGYPDFAGSK
jgi:hypothetical protein